MAVDPGLSWEGRGEVGPRGGGHGRSRPPDTVPVLHRASLPGPWPTGVASRSSPPADPGPESEAKPSPDAGSGERPRPGALCVVPADWCLVPGAWCLVPGALCLVPPGTWCLVWWMPVRPISEIRGEEGGKGRARKGEGEGRGRRGEGGWRRGGDLMLKFICNV